MPRTEPKHSELFSHEPPKEEFDRTPIRPLGPISHYVVETLPLKLEEIREGKGKIKQLETDGEIMLHKFMEIPRSIPQDQYNLALVDLLFLQSAIGNNGGIPPENLSRTISQFAEKIGRQIPTLLYSDLIHVNPLEDDPRVFHPLHTLTGWQEYDFYRTHASFEYHGGRIKNALLTAIVSLTRTPRPKIDDAVTALREVGIGSKEELIAAEEHGVENHAMEILALIKRIGTFMHEDSFHLYRKYFYSFPDNFDGASGKNTPTVPLFELYLGGDGLQEERINYIEQSLPYFSPIEQQEINVALLRVESEVTLDDITAQLGDPPELLELLYGMDHLLMNFRELHLIAVANKLNDALRNKVSGTGGEQNVGRFLRENIRPHIIRPKK